MKAVQFHEFGKNPADAVRVESSPVPKPGPDELLLRMHFAPINPADLNFIQGTYGVLPELPAVPGGEGYATVEDLGGNLEGRFAVGDRVIVLGRIGTWRQFVLAGADDVFRLPFEIEPQQAAMLGVNPATAWLMIEENGPWEPGDWLAQNAANSGVGRCVIQIARQKGLRTANLVRRESLVEELKAIGGDLVLLDREGVVEEIRQAVNPGAVKVALNAVGGDSALRLLGVLGSGGRHVTYGAMSGRSLKVPNGLLIFRELTLRGFWVSQWKKRKSTDEIAALYQELAKMVKEETLIQPVAAVYPIDEAREAVAHAAKDSRDGKILLSL